MFIIKSEYRLIMNEKTSHLGESFSTQQQAAIWKQAWKMKIPLKIKIFAWMACCDNLPTIQNLKKKKTEESVLFATKSRLTSLMHSFTAKAFFNGGALQSMSY